VATVVSNAGRAIQTNLVSGLGGTAPNYIAIGSGAGTSAVADTTLFTEYTTGTWTGYARVNATPTRATTSVTNDTIKWSGSFTAGASQTVTNAGNFDASANGNMLVKGDFTGVALANGDSITINISLQYT
jgi:hypothetical protein